MRHVLNSVVEKRLKNGHGDENGWEGEATVGTRAAERWGLGKMVEVGGGGQMQLCVVATLSQRKCVRASVTNACRMVHADEHSPSSEPPS